MGIEDASSHVPMVEHCCEATRVAATSPANGGPATAANGGAAAAANGGCEELHCRLGGSSRPHTAQWYTAPEGSLAVSAPPANTMEAAFADAQAKAATGQMVQVGAVGESR